MCHYEIIELNEFIEGDIESAGDAIWRTGLSKLNNIIGNLDINNQWPLFDKICECHDKKTLF